MYVSFCLPQATTNIMISKYVFTYILHMKRFINRIMYGVNKKKHTFFRPHHDSDCYMLMLKACKTFEKGDYVKL